jgi:hypothetical protein
MLRGSSEIARLEKCRPPGKSKDIPAGECQKTRIGELWEEGDARLCNRERWEEAEQLRSSHGPVPNDFIRRSAVRKLDGDVF